VFGTGIGFVGIHLFLSIGQQFFEGLGVVLVARGIVNGLDEAVLIDIDVCLIAVGTGLLAVGRDLDVVTGFAVLGVFLALARAALLGLNDGGTCAPEGIKDTNFASLDR
jgi:hypothetical protein